VSESPAAEQSSEAPTAQRVPWLSARLWVSASGVLLLIFLVAFVLRTFSLFTSLTGFLYVFSQFALLVLSVALLVAGALFATRLGSRALIPAASALVAWALAGLLFSGLGALCVHLDFTLKLAARQRVAVAVIERYRDSSGVRALRIGLPASEGWLSDTGSVVYIQAPRLRAVYFPRFTNVGDELGDYYIDSATGTPPGGGPWDAFIQGDPVKIRRVAPHWFEGYTFMDFSD